jgi:hypothetical protein
MPAPARTELLSAGAVSGLKFRKSSFFAKNSCDHRLVEDGGNWRLSIDDIRNSNLVSCNASSLMKSGSQGIRFPAPPGAEDCSPGRKPWERRPTPRLRHPSPARAGEGTGVREGSPTHGSRRGLSFTAPIGAVELFSEYGIYSTNLSYRTLEIRNSQKMLLQPSGAEFRFSAPTISNQAAAAGHSPITDHQSPIGNENLVFRCGRRPRCLD